MTTSFAWGKTALVILLSLLAVGWEICVRPFLPSFFQMPLFLPWLILLLVSGSRWRAYVALFVGTVCLHLYAFTMHDALVMRWFLVFLGLDVLSHHFFTNRSFYVTLALASLGYVGERGTSWLVGSLLWRLGLSPYPWTIQPGLGAGFFWNLVLVGVGFLCIAAFTKRFSPMVGRRQAMRLFPS